MNFYQTHFYQENKYLIWYGSILLGTMILGLIVYTMIKLFFPPGRGRRAATALSVTFFCLPMVVFAKEGAGIFPGIWVGLYSVLNSWQHSAFYLSFGERIMRFGSYATLMILYWWFFAAIVYFLMSKFCRKD